MPQASITINGTPGSDTNLPINTLVQLNNQNTGGELTYLWTILDQPPGTTDALSSAVIQNPTFTPKKEGTYLIKLVVNAGLVNEQENRVVASIRQLKTLERIPAAGETTEGDTSDGWASATNSLLRSMDRLLANPGVIVGVNASGGNLNMGDVVRSAALSTLKSTLPGEEKVPGFSKAFASSITQIDELLCIVEGTPAGGTTVANGAVMRVRYIGIPYRPDTGAPQTFSGSPTAGDSVYLSDSGVPSLTPGTYKRQLGSVISSGGGTYSVWFNGVGGADNPIDLRYVVYGSSGVLTNAFRVDGPTNASSVSGGTPFTIKTGDATTITFALRRFSSGGYAMQQWQSDAGAALVQVTALGDLDFLDTGGGTSRKISFLSGSGLNIHFAAGALIISDAGGTFNSLMNEGSANTAWRLAGPTYTSIFKITAPNTLGLSFLIGSQSSGSVEWIVANTTRVTVSTTGLTLANGLHLFADNTSQIRFTNMWLVPGSTTLGARYSSDSNNVFAASRASSSLGGAIGGSPDGTVTWKFEADSTGAKVQAGTTTNHPLEFLTNSTVKWKIDASGNLVNVGSGDLTFAGTTGIKFPAWNIHEASGVLGVYKIAAPTYPLFSVGSNTSDSFFMEGYDPTGALHWTFNGDDSAGYARFGTVSSHNLRFIVANNDAWEINTTNRDLIGSTYGRIRDVANPQDPGDVVTKLAYEVGTRSGRNLIVNSDFEIWQRYGSSLQYDVTHTAASGVYSRGYGCDRFYVAIQNATTNNSGCYARSTRQTSGLGNSTYNIRIAPVWVSGGSGSVFLVQEIDRSLIKAINSGATLLDGRCLSWSFKIRKSGFSTPVTLEYKLQFGTGSVNEYAVQPYTGFNTIISTTQSTSTLSGTWTTVNLTSAPYYTGSSATCMGVMIGIPYSSANTGTDYIEIAEMVLTVGPAVAHNYTKAGGSFDGEMRLCEAFYEKSYKLTDDTGTSTIICEESGFATGGVIVHPGIRFRSRKWKTPSIAIWSSVGTSGKWYNYTDLTDLSASAQGIADSGFRVEFSASQTLGDAVAGHWEADAEI